MLIRPRLCKSKFSNKQFWIVWDFVKAIWAQKNIKEVITTFHRWKAFYSIEWQFVFLDFEGLQFILEMSRAQKLIKVCYKIYMFLKHENRY